ncbi:MAG: hypothetical protein ACRDNF_21570 [Streptosporangiaceae bacterium]
MTDLTGLAKQQLGRIKVLLNNAGLKYYDIPNDLFGAGVAVGFGENEYIILSVMGGGMESHLLLTCGILKSIKQDRLAALEACNSFNKSNTAYPVFLHDAKTGWAIIMQQTLPIDVLVESLEYFATLVRSLPQIAKDYRNTLGEDQQLSGQPWVWNDEDLDSLLIRSML